RAREAEQSELYEWRVLLRWRRAIHHCRRLSAVWIDAAQWRPVKWKKPVEPANCPVNAFPFHSGHTAGPSSRRKFWIERASCYGPDSKRDPAVRRKLRMERRLQYALLG